MPFAAADLVSFDFYAHRVTLADPVVHYTGEGVILATETGHHGYEPETLMIKVTASPSYPANTVIAVGSLKCRMVKSALERLAELEVCPDCGAPECGTTHGWCSERTERNRPD